MATKTDTKSSPKTETKKKPALKATASKVAKTKAEGEAPHATARATHIPHTKRELIGSVISDKMQKTIVVKVDRQVRHSLYKKYLTRSRKFKAHDEKNDAKQGDLVVIIESRPLSKDKRWALKKILRKAIPTTAFDAQVEA